MAIQAYARRIKAFFSSIAVRKKPKAASYAKGELDCHRLCLRNDGFAVIGALLLFLLPITAQAANNDATIKAAYLYRILHFIEFPTSSPSDDFTICIIGKDDPFKYAKTSLEERRLESYRIKLVQKQRNEPLTGCRVAYITDSETSNIAETVNTLTSKGILTVSSISQFAKVGGMIGFTEYNDTLRLEINTKALEAAEFEIDPHLLEVSLNVY